MLNKKYTNYTLIFAALFIESFFLFCFAPKYYFYEFDCFCAIQFVISSFVFIKIQKKENYFDFDSLFLLTYFFVLFFYPVFLYQTLPKIFLVYQYPFNENVISRCTALSLLGSQAYMFGSIIVNIDKIKTTEHLNNVKINTNLLTLLSFLSFAFFLIVAGTTFFTKTYGDTLDSNLFQYFLIFFQAVFFSTLILEVYNWLVFPSKKKYKINISLVLLAIIVVVLFLYSGSRTIPLEIVLMLVGIITIYKFNINFFKFIICAFVGILAMFATVIMRGYEGVEIGDEGGLVQVVMDLIINNRNTFVAVDFVDNNGLTYGQSMLSNFLAPIPFLQNVFFTVFNINPNLGSSSLMITGITLGEDSEWGLGTNIIADIYMSFGVIGVCVFMFFLGYTIKRALYKAKYQKNLYSLVYYAIMMSLAVFIVRAEFFFFLRLFLWCLLIIYLYKQYYIISKENKINSVKIQ
jgi:oligosaccharide repeat unit polymerase